MNNNISFQSKINFVDINKFTQKRYSELGKYVDYDIDSPLFIKGDVFYTDSVKTCTAGGLTDGKTKALGFHWLDNEENFLHIDQMCNCIFDIFKNKNINGLIIGGKKIKGREYSLETIDQVIDYFTKKINNLSIFQEHIDKYGSTSYIYNLKQDTWTLSTGYIDEKGKYHCAQNLDDLKKCYRQITIADNDTLYFDGIKVPKQKLEAIIH